mmetsp:Transcript_57211/g.134666  ORF Transcript_57211/g.134666 Transcript_57211/m.134666 type:complete len:434 (-) Transcript_57211:55-1356(-)
MEATPAVLEMAEKSKMEYASALEQACVQLKMLQCALWTKEKIDDDDEAALQSAMMAVRTLQKQVTPSPQNASHSPNTVKPPKVRRSWSKILGRSFRTIIGKQQRDPAAEPEKPQRELTAHRTGATLSVASTTSSVAWSQESLQEGWGETSFASDDDGNVMPTDDGTGPTRLKSSPPPPMRLGAPAPAQSLGRSPPAGAQREKEELEHLEAQVERALRKVLVEFSKKGADGECGASQASQHSTATGYPSEHRSSRDLSAEMNDMSSSSSSPAAAQKCIVQLAVTEAVAEMVSSVAAAVAETEAEDDSNPPSQQSHAYPPSEPETWFGAPAAHRSPSDLLESTVAIFTSFVQSLSPDNSPSKSASNKSSPSRQIAEAAEPSGICDAPPDPAVKVRDEEVGEIGDELLVAIALVKEEEASPQHTPSKPGRAKTIDL